MATMLLQTIPRAVIQSGKLAANVASVELVSDIRSRSTVRTDPPLRERGRSVRGPTRHAAGRARARARAQLCAGPCTLRGGARAIDM